MKKLAKVLAVVLAIALLACPFASAVSSVVDAGADNDALTVGIVGETDKAVRVTVESKDGFVAAQGWLDVTGVTLDEDKDPGVPDYSVLNGTFEEDEYEPSVDVSLVNGVISFIVTAADSASLAKYVKVVVDIPVILADDFSVTATKFVAGDDIENEETFIEIGFTDKDGVIDAQNENVQASVTDEDLEPEIPEPVIDTNITFYGRSLYVDKQLGIIYQLTKSQLSSYARYEVVVTPHKYDANYNEFVGDAVVLTDIVNATKTHPYTIYEGIAMYGLGIQIDAYVKCYDADDNFVAYSATVSDIPADLLKATYYTAPSLTDAQKVYNAVVTDLLNMSAEAQKYFGNLKTTSELHSATLVNEGFSQAYASETVTAEDLVKENSTTPGASNPLDLTKNVFSQSCNLGAAPALQYMFQKKSGGITLDKSKLVMTVTYTTLYKGEKEVSEVVSGDMWLTSGNYTYYVFDKTSLYDGNKIVSATVTYDGVKVLDNTCALESYLSGQLSNPNTGAVTTAIAKFGISIRKYFAGS